MEAFMRGESPKVRKAPSHLESSLQQLCVKYMYYAYPQYRGLFFSIPNGAHVNKIHAKILKAEGLTAGVADTFFAVPANGYHGLFIEFKIASTKWDENGKPHDYKTSQRKDQREWQQVVEQQGYRYAVVRKYDEFVELIKEYLK